MGVAGDRGRPGEGHLDGVRLYGLGRGLDGLGRGVAGYEPGGMVVHPTEPHLGSGPSARGIGSPAPPLGTGSVEPLPGSGSGEPPLDRGPERGRRGSEQAGGTLPARAAVLAPAPLLTVTVEGRQGEDEVHLHAGGQGFWVARMVRALGVPATLVGTFGGETGPIVRGLVEVEGIATRAVAVRAGNPTYVHDRRSGRRLVVAETPPEALTRHELDELYGAMLVEGLSATVSVLGGPYRPGVLPADVYRRLAGDLRANGRRVVADLSGDPLRAVLEGGVDVLKVSDEELVADELAHDRSVEEIQRAIHDLRSRGAERVVVTRGERPALATVGAGLVEVLGPRLEVFDHRGAGDSMTAGLAVATALGEGFEAGLRRGAAAGCLNVTRRGLATGDPYEISQLARSIVVRPAGSGNGDEEQDDGRRDTATPDELAARARPT